MRQVSGCDFCGDTPSGAFEVLPPAYDPDSNGKRMVLCDHCRDALASVLDPLLAASEPTPDPSTGSPDVEPDVDRSPGGTPDADNEPGVDDGVEPGPKGKQATAPAGEPESAAEQATDSETAATGAGTASRVPKGYRKVLRFFENRELPLDRETAVEMAAGAYGLDEAAVAAAIDHADSHDRLRVTQGEIRKP